MVVSRMQTDGVTNAEDLMILDRVEDGIAYVKSSGITVAEGKEITQPLRINFLKQYSGCGYACTASQVTGGALRINFANRTAVDFVNITSNITSITLEEVEIGAVYYVCFEAAEIGLTISLGSGFYLPDGIKPLELTRDIFSFEKIAEGVILTTYKGKF